MSLAKFSISLASRPCALALASAGGGSGAKRTASMEARQRIGGSGGVRPSERVCVLVLVCVRVCMCARVPAPADST